MTARIIFHIGLTVTYAIVALLWLHMEHDLPLAILFYIGLNFLLLGGMIELGAFAGRRRDRKRYLKDLEREFGEEGRV